MGQILHFVSLVISLQGSLLVLLLKAIDLAPHLCSLNFHGLDLMLDHALVLSELGHLVTFADGLITQAIRLEELFIQDAFASVHLISQVTVLL